MSENEIIYQIKDLIKDRESYFTSTDEEDDIFRKDKQALEGIIDLYNEEKEKNASLKKQIKLMQSINITENFIEKSKIREKIESIKKDCEKCRFKETGICEELNKNNQCTQGTMLETLQELLEEE